MADAVTFQRVQPPSRQVHVRRLCRHVQSSEDPRDFGDQRWGNPPPVPHLEQTLEASVAKADDHAASSLSIADDDSVTVRLFR